MIGTGDGEVLFSLLKQKRKIHARVQSSPPRIVFTPNCDGLASVESSLAWKTSGLGLHLVLHLPWQTMADYVEKKDTWIKVNVKSAEMSWLAQIPRTEQDEEYTASGLCTAYHPLFSSLSRA